MKKYIMIFGMIMTVPNLVFAQTDTYLGQIRHQTAKTGTVSEPKPVHISHLLNNPQFLNQIAPFAEKAKQNKSLRKVSNDNVGDTANFFVYNTNNNVFEPKAFRLMEKGSLSQIWFEVAEINNAHLNQEVADTMLVYLETKSGSESWNQSKGVIALGNEVFGNAPDFDGDQMVDVLVTDVKDSYNGTTVTTYTAGFFYSVDQLTDTDAQSIGARSNERDIIYIDSYPGIFRSEEPNPKRPLSTLIHEYQHLIHYNYNTRVGSNEYTFINESQSQFAQTVGGFFEKYSNSNYDYFQDTNYPMFMWDRNNQTPGGTLKDYDRGTVWGTYIWDQLGFENAKFGTQSSQTGPNNYNSAFTSAGSSETYETMLVNFAIANWINNKAVDSKFGYGHSSAASWKAKPNEVADNFNRSDLKVRVKNGGIYYLTYKDVTNFTFNASFGTAGRVMIITKYNGETNVIPFTSGSNFETETGLLFNEVTIVFINIKTDTTSGFQNGEDPGVSTLAFTYSSTGEEQFVSSTVTTASSLAYFWAFPSGNGVRVGHGYRVSPPTNNESQVLEVGYELYIDPANGAEIVGNPELIIGFYPDLNMSGPTYALDSVVVPFDELNTNGMSYIDVTEKNWKTNGDFYIGQYVRAAESEEMPFLSDNGTVNSGRSYIIKNDGTWQSASSYFSNEQTPYYNFLQSVVYRTSTITNITDDGLVKPDVIQLDQNYPNPFNPSTTIRFSIPPNLSGENVSLMVYNTLGQVVRQLYSGPATAGSNVYSWNGFTDSGSQAGSGLYFYVLKTNSQTLSKSMILLK